MPRGCTSAMGRTCFPGLAEAVRGNDAPEAAAQLQALAEAINRAANVLLGGLES